MKIHNPFHDGLLLALEKRAAFAEQASDYLVLRKLAGFGDEMVGGIEGEGKSIPIGERQTEEGKPKDYCPGCTKKRELCSCESSVKEAGILGSLRVAKTVAKQGLEKMPRAIGGGAAIGAVGGAMAAGEGNRLKGALGGAAVGAGAGAIARRAVLRGSAKIASLVPIRRVPFEGVVVPTSANSSINAREGELLAIVKEAFVTKALKFIGRNPYARSAAVWGGAGAVTGAIAAKPGSRMRGALKGGLIGGVGGVAAGGVEKGLSRFAKAAGAYDSSDLFDAKSRAAEKYPVEITPSFADESLSLFEAVKKKVHQLRKTRADIISGANPKRERKPPLPIPSDLDKLAWPSRKALPVIGATALGMGIMNYLDARPKKELGGKSKTEVKFQSDVASNKAQATEGDHLPKRLRHRMKEFQSGLSTDFRKSPLAAGGIGALVGALTGTQLAKILGAR